MSSHHIVRDDQEPALIIANGESCNRELLNQLLEWSPLVVVLDSAIERVIELGIKVDVLIGDFDRDFDYKKYEALQYPIEIIKVEDQNSTDLDKAYNYLIKRNIHAANVVWATGKRADHTFTNLTNVIKFANDIKIVFLDDHSKVFLLPKTFIKWYPKNTPISLIPLGKVDNITTENLAYPLQNEYLEIGFRSGSSNHVIDDGIVKIIYTAGFLLMMECFD